MAPNAAKYFFWMSGWLIQCDESSDRLVVLRHLGDHQLVRVDAEPQRRVAGRRDEEVEVRGVLLGRLDDGFEVLVPKIIAASPL